MRLLLALLLLALPAYGHASHEALVRQVTITENEFAATMANRDFEAFKSFLDEEAVFISGESTLTGKDNVASSWANYFTGPDAPFSWKPEQVEVLESGEIALSTGPVFGPEGKRAATFTSVWRLNGNGQWRIILDKGNRYCE